MTTVYQNCPSTVDTPAPLPFAVLSFYRWLWRWFHQTGDVSPSTPYFAKKQRKSERTIYRWLAALRDAGWISIDVIEGVERRIVPLVEPPATPRKRSRSASKMSGVVSGVVSGVPPYRESNAVDTETTTQSAPAMPGEPALPAAPAAPGGYAVSAGADDLISVGVPQRVAVNLIQSHGMDAARRALEAFKRAKGVQNPVGWIVRAIERGYQTAPITALESSERAKTVKIPVKSPAPVNGLTGRAAFDALRDKMRLGGRV